MNSESLLNRQQYLLIEAILSLILYIKTHACTVRSCVLAGGLEGLFYKVGEDER